MEANKFIALKQPAYTPIGEINLAEERGRILIIDDDKLVLEALRMTLEKEGYDVETAKNGEEAIKMIENSSPALIICDQFLPGMKGIEVLEKALELRPDSIRILLTASQDAQTAINAINIGQVHQYMTKPWKDSDLRKSVKMSFEKYKLIRENQVLQNLIFTQHKRLEKAHENLQYELKLGAQIHGQLLLGKVPKNLQGLQIEAKSLPSKEIDGDFFEFYQPSSDFLDMVIGDVMGKGIAAALVGTAVKSQLMRFAVPFPFSQRYEKQKGWSTNLLSPEQILWHVHKGISRQLIDLEFFVSLFFGRFNLRYKTFSYIDCGSSKPLHYSAKDKKIVRLTGDDFPIGVVEEAPCRARETCYNEGDIFVFYSDGVSEARSRKNSFFGVERIEELLKHNANLKASELTDLILAEVLSFTQSEKLDDDLTLVVIKIERHEKPQSAQKLSADFISDLSQLQDVRNFVKRVCGLAPGDTERLGNEMALVVNEAFCNIVKHGHLENSKKSIKIIGELEVNGAIFQIQDQGVPFDPSEINEPSFCGRHDTGYGWHIIKQLVDQISYTRKEELGDWNRLNLYKRYYFGESKMNVSHKQEGKILIITPDGENLDARDAVDFKEKVIELINNHNNHGVVFDLNRLQFIDSSGLGSFLSVLRLLHSRGGDLKLSRMNKPIRVMFELVKMHKIFEIFNSTEEAVESFD